MRCFVVPDGGSSGVQNTYAQIIAIHAALLANGKIVYFSGDQHDPGQFAHSLFDHGRLFDCTTFAVSSCTPAPGISDLFCCSHAFLPSGKLLIAGGTKRFAGFEGAPQAWIFDPATSSFSAISSMSDGRWYPTLITLGNGGVLAISGINAAGTDDNRNLEVFGPIGSSWVVEGVCSYNTGTLYPRVHLLPDGHVFFVTDMNGQCMVWRPGMPAPTAVCACPFTGQGFSAYSSALLPLLPEEDYIPRIVVANIAQPQVIDLSVSSPAWTNTGTRSLAGGLSTPPLRYNGTLTLLPTGEVLSAGGEEAYGDETHPVLALEIYRPATNSWTTLPASTTVTRAYHSVALLMPDGRVWFAGSNKRCDWSFHNSADYPGPEPTTLQEVVGGVPVDNRELRIEIFEPWYVGRPDRPTFSLGGLTSVGVGRSFTITSPQAASISRVALVRGGSCTHAFNSDQRYIGLTFTVSTTSLNVSVPDKENLVPPGPYLIFVLAQVVDSGSGAVLDVPSAGQWIEVTNTKIIKELKPEVEHVKYVFEHLSKDFDVVDPGPLNPGDPPQILQSIAVAIDNVARGAASARSFIQPQERPLLPQVSAAQLAAVPIYAIDAAVLQRQISMEGMMNRVNAPMDVTKQEKPQEKPSAAGAKKMDKGKNRSKG